MEDSIPATNNKKESFWKSATGTITKITVLITAIIGIIVIANQFKMTKVIVPNHSIYNKEENNKKKNSKPLADPPNSIDSTNKRSIIGTWTAIHPENREDPLKNVIMDPSISFLRIDKETVQYVEGGLLKSTTLFTLKRKDPLMDTEAVLTLQLSREGSWKTLNGRLIVTIKEMNMQPSDEVAYKLQNEQPEVWGRIISLFKEMDSVRKELNFIINGDQMSQEDIVDKTRYSYVRQS